MQFEQNACDPSAELGEGGKHIKIKVENSKQRLYLRKSMQTSLSIMICETCQINNLLQIVCSPPSTMFEAPEEKKPLYHDLAVS